MMATCAYMAMIAIGYISFRMTTKLSGYRVTSISELTPFIILGTLAFYCYFATAFNTKSTWTTIDHTREPIYQAQLARAAHIKPLFIQSAHANDTNPSCIFPSIETKRNNCRRFCRTCEAFKPDRTHHCHICKRCLLGSDHHCVFLNNCIALHNRKMFVLFLFYASLACLYVCGDIILTNPVQIVNQRDIWTAMFTVALFVMTTASGIAVFGFLSLHLWMITKNTTTIDMMEKRYKHRMSNPVNPFDISLMDNVCHVMGPVWAWLLPINVKASRTPQSHQGQIWNEMRDSGIVSDIIASYEHPQNGWFGLSKSKTENDTLHEESVDNDEHSDTLQPSNVSTELRQRKTMQNGNG